MNIALTTLVLIAACALALLATGCTHNRPFRTDSTFKNSSQTGIDPSTASIESTQAYKLGFVEFDDQGWFWDTNQVAKVEHMVRSEAGVGSTNNPQGIIMLVFVHGWKNNAAYDNTNVVMLRNTLTQLNRAEQLQTNHPARKVVGVYAGWRGLSATSDWFPPLAMELSFWERKNTAHKVGGYGALTELLVDMESLQQASNDSLATNAPRTELIIVGHSFGGGAVYSAISEIVTERFVDTVKRGQPLKPLGDQVILLNPAFEGARHYTLNQMAVSINQYPTNQRPVLSIFTSKGDWATHYFFPLGRFFSTMFEKNRDAQQKYANWQAVGWFKPFVTHDLNYNTNAAALGVGNSTFNLTTQKHELHGSSQMRATIENIHEQRQKWHPNNAHGTTYYFDDSILKPRDDYRPGNPFLIVSVDKKIMKDHNDITNPILINFLEEYILFCQTDPQDHSKPPSPHH